MPSPTQPAAKPEREYISWERVGRAANDIAEALHKEFRSGEGLAQPIPWEPDVWVYLHRGGAIPAALIWRAYVAHGRARSYNLVPVSVQSYNLQDQQVTSGMNIDFRHLEQEGRLIGKNVLIIDDLIDTGFSMAKVKEIIEGKGAKSVKTAVLFTKIYFGADFFGETVSPHVWLDFPWEREASNFV